MTADGALPRTEEPPPMDEAEWQGLLDHHAAVAPATPGERRRLNLRLVKAASKERAVAEVKAFARLRPEHRDLIEELTGYWRKALSATRRDVDPLVQRVWEGGQQRAAERSTLKRFRSYDVEPGRVADLREDHPALDEARTIFPTTVTLPWLSQRLLVSGHNNRKLGGKVEKGPWAGFPIYHLTLEERASCPRSCAMWAGCYGSAMHLARRHDHRGENFIDFLAAELWLLAREHRKGFVVRLHTLGDFYSVEYVRFWAEMIDKLPMLHCFGYTSNHPDAADEGEAAIGQAIATLTDAAWDQFAIRFSNTRRPQGAVVIDDVADAGEAIPCPAQHGADEDGKSEACATCGLCWSAGARDKTIAFLRHGMKARSA